MDLSPAPGVPSPDWLRPRAESQGLVRYVSTVLERRWLVAAVTLATVLVALLYVALAPKTYVAGAGLVGPPGPGGQPNPLGLGPNPPANGPAQGLPAGRAAGVQPRD